ncbi:MAG: hypothetical protein NXI30_06940 [bacterium]|nr:hypothetical protein [bacterium]
MHREAAIRSSPSPAPRRGSGGFALIAALALLAVLGTTGALMIRMNALQTSAASQAVLGERAEWAARAGTEWARAAAVAAVGCPSASTTLTLSGGALSGQSVVVSCTESRHVEDDAERLSVHLSVSVSDGSPGRDFVYREETLAIAFVDPATVGGGGGGGGEEEEDDEEEVEEDPEEEEEPADEPEEDEGEEEDEEDDEEDEDDDGGWGWLGWLLRWLFGL